MHQWKPYLEFQNYTKYLRYTMFWTGISSMKKVLPELDKIVDMVLAYRPKPIHKKKRVKKTKKT